MEEIMGWAQFIVQNTRFDRGLFNKKHWMRKLQGSCWLADERHDHDTHTPGWLTTKRRITGRTNSRPPAKILRDEDYVPHAATIDHRW
jgi:hypothetical protein